MNLHRSTAPERTSRCGKCGVTLSLDSRAGFCAGCLFLQAVTGFEGGVEDLSKGTANPHESPAPPRIDDQSPNPVTVRRFGNYELLEELGRGGMGIVYKARQMGMGRLVALKLLRFGPLAGDEFVRRLRMEATAAGCLRHANIVTIHEVGIHQDQHYLAMDYVAGPNLAKLAGHQPLLPKRAAHFAKGIAEAIHYAHEAGVLHRDLKPSNILVEGEDHPCITDFGLAKRMDLALAEAGQESMSSLTLTGQVLGSPNYMPPEQAAANKGKVGRTSDVYSMGAILYELLTGRPPFLGDTLAATLHQVLEVEPVPPRLLLPNVPADLETICLKCLEKEPERRYATAQALAEELGRYLNGDPILARPLSSSQRAWRWCRKNPAITALVGIILTLLLLLAIGSPIAAFQINRARQEAELKGRRAQASETELRRQLYAGNMNLLQAAWDANHFLRVRELLKETEAFSDRGFEWYFWRQQAQQALTVLQGHSGYVAGTVFSPHGRLLATSGSDGTVRIWDVANGHELFLLEGHTAPVHSVAWFPDSRRLVSGSEDHTLKIWDATTGALLTTMRSERGRITSVAVSVDGQWIAASSRDKTALVWPGTGVGTPAVMRGHAAEVWQVVFSPDGRFLATASGDHTARIWNIATGETVQILAGHTREVRSVAFSPDGQRVVSAGEDWTAMIWEATSGRMLHQLKGHSDFIMGAIFSPDGRWIATASSDRSARLWETTTGREAAVFNAHENQVFGINFSPDGQWLATGSADAKARLWDLRHELKSLRFQAHDSPVLAVAFSPDSQWLATGGEDRTVKIHEAKDGQLKLALKGLRSAVRAATFSPDGRRIATLAGDGTVNLWESANGQELLKIVCDSSTVESMAFSPDSESLVTGAWDGRVQIWDVTSGQQRSFWQAHTNPITAIAYSPDGQRIASGDWFTLKVQESSSGREIVSIISPAFATFAIAFSPDGKQVLSGHQDRAAKLWDAKTGQEIHVFRGFSGSVDSVAFSPDGQRLLLSNADRSTKLFDAVTGQPLLTFPTGIATTTAAAFSPDGRRVAVASVDGQVNVWEATSDEQVNAWEEQEVNAGQRVARFEQAREETLRQRRLAQVMDPGVLREWLVLAPIPYNQSEVSRQYGQGERQWLVLEPIRVNATQTAIQALEQEFLPGEGQLRPQAGEVVKLGDKDLVWQAVRQKDYRLDFTTLTSQRSEYCVGYAVCYLETATAREHVRLLIGSDDLAKVYLNGEPVYRVTLQRGLQEDEDTVEGLKLQKGVNTLVFKIVNIHAGWMGSLRLTDAHGRPLSEIKVKLTP